jgi:predicted short-subunit dehydrogenase-like oxidoreductase (DUF2520 family)
MRNLRIGIIGAGRIGTALAFHLSRAGWRIAGIQDIEKDRAEKLARIIPTGTASSPKELARRADILFLSVPDSEIAHIAESLGEIEKYRARFLFHFSGILPARILHLAGMERAVYSLHPFGGIPPGALEKNPFFGLYFSGEGESPAKPIATQIAKDLDGIFVEIDSSKKTTYHLAASLVANHMFALLSAGERLMAESGLQETISKSMITQLAKSAIENYREHGALEGLTGPVVRKDELTIAEHLIEADKHGLFELYSAGIVELRRLMSNANEDIID